MSTYRVVHNKDNPYYIKSRIAPNDPLLSFKAKGIHDWLMSKPDDWLVIMDVIIKASSDGETSVRSGIKELEAHGYVQRRRVTDEKTGKVLRWETHVFESPQEPDPNLAEDNEPDVDYPDVENPHVDNPDVDNQALLSKDIQSKDKLSKKIGAADADASLDLENLEDEEKLAEVSLSSASSSEDDDTEETPTEDAVDENAPDHIGPTGLPESERPNDKNGKPLTDIQWYLKEWAEAQGTDPTKLNGQGPRQSAGAKNLLQNEISIPEMVRAINVMKRDNFNTGRTISFQEVVKDAPAILQIDIPLTKEQQDIEDLMYRLTSRDKETASKDDYLTIKRAAVILQGKGCTFETMTEWYQTWVKAYGVVVRPTPSSAQQKLCAFIDDKNGNPFDDAPKKETKWGEL